MGVFRFFLTIALCMGIWLAIPSRLFYNPTAVSIDGYDVTVSRTAPMSEIFGKPIVSYTQTVRALNRPSQPCRDDNGAGFTFEVQGATGTWNIESWAARCMTGPYHWRAEWTVKLFGIIPLRPVDLDLIVKPGAPN